MKRRRLAAASFALATASVGLVGLSSPAAHATPGALDPSFGTLGVSTQPGPANTGTTGATGLAIMLPGVTGATAQAGDEVLSGTDGTNFQVARLTSTGAMDTAFGTGGTTNAFGGAANAVAEITAGALSGDVVAVGSSNALASSTGVNPCSARGPAIAAFTTAGILDTRFGTGGVTCFTGQPSSPYSFLPGGAFNSVAVDPSNGNVVAAGQIVTQGGTVEQLIQRLAPTGSPDTSFGTGGFVTLAPGSGNSAALAVALAPNGDIVTGGYSVNDGGVQQATAAAVTSAGALDATVTGHTGFGAAGTATVGTATESAAYGLAIQPTASGWDAYLAGSVTASDGTGNNHPFLADFTQAGTPDTAFNTTGQLTSSVVGEYRAATTAPGGVLVAAGFSGSGVSEQMLLNQYNAATGAPNTKFASSGQLTQGFAAGPGSLAAVAVQPDGKAVGAGVDPTVNATPAFGVIRALGPTLTPGTIKPTNVTAATPITLQVPFTTDEPLFAATQPVFCVATYVGSVLPAGTSCTNVTATLPANATAGTVSITVTPAPSPGNQVTVLVTPSATNGFVAGPAVREVVRREQPGRTDGYWLAAADGGIFNYGRPFYGSAGSLPLVKPVVGMAPTPDGKGYWMVAADGGIFNYGDAKYYGSAGNLKLTQPVVGMAATPDGKGYWLVAADGGIFNYGDAHFYGSAGNLKLTKPVVGMAATPDGLGYWLVAADGGIFNYGDAPFKGGAGSLTLTKPIVGMAADPGAAGYWLVASDGGIFNYGDTAFYGSAGSLPLVKPVVGMAASPDGQGYWLVAADGGIFNYGDAHFDGSAGSINLTKPIVGMGS